MQRIFTSLGIAAFLLIATGHLFAQDGFSGALSESTQITPWKPPVGTSRVALADFDGDHRLDGVVLVPIPAVSVNSYRISLHLSAERNDQFTFTSSERELRVAAFDVDGDGDVDVVVERPFSRERLFVWINDGSGHFVPGSTKDYAATSPLPGATVEGALMDPPLAVSCVSTRRGTDHGLRARDSLPAPREPNLLCRLRAFVPRVLYSSLLLPSRAPPQSTQL